MDIYDELFLRRQQTFGLYTHRRLESRDSIGQSNRGFPPSLPATKPELLSKEMRLR
jgi:hypothetical protein